MAVKIGTLLVEAGVISAPQLEEALQAQVMFGGRIGTNLIELGFITEEFLAQFLAKQFNIPFCHQAQLKNIPEAILDLVPRDMVAKHRIIPVRETKNEIWLAMIDPTSLEAIKDIGFVTNHKVFPMIAPEVQVIEAMERYYHIPKDQRYVQLSDASNVEDMSLTHSTREFLDDTHSPITQPVRADDGIQFPGEAKAAPLKLEPRRTVEPAAAPISTPLLDPKVVDELFPLQDIAEVLTEVRSKEDIFQAIKSPFLEFFTRYALFINKKDVMVGYDGYGEGFTKQKIESISIPLNVPSIFRDVAERKIPIFGPLPNGHNNQRLANLLEINQGGGPVFLCPIPLVEKVGVVIYADRCHDNQAVAQRLDKFRMLMAKAGIAFQVLVLKQKILL